MRLQEAISLSIDDVDLEQGVILVRNTKFKKNRYVVIHETVSSILGEFAKRRDEFFGGRRPRFFFPSRRGRRFSNSDLSEYFINALVDLGMRPRRGKGPRIHDFRHRFATATITELYRAGRDLESSLPILATYLGHGKIEHTYQYMALVPELKIEALRRLSISEQAQFYGASA
jgi:integrase